MQVPIRRRRGTSRGQALVEFAIILPVLLLLLLLAIDFGRVFFGWVALQNASRIGANEAAKNPLPWSLGDTSDLFYERIARELSVINCTVPDYDGDGRTNQTDGRTEMIEDLKAAPSPAVQPVFIENAEDPNNHYQVGDEVSVKLACDFGFVTPLVGNIVGDPMTITAVSTFMIFGGEIAGVPVPPDPEPAGCIGADLAVPDMVGMTVLQARTTWTNAGFTGVFTPSSGFDTDIVKTQTTVPASNPGDCLIYGATVSVTHQAPNPCGVGKTTVPNLVTMTVAQARAAWSAAGFTGTFTPSSGSDTDVVSAQTTNPSASPGTCAVITTTVNVTHAPPNPPPGQCRMPQVLGFTISAARTAYQNAGFTGAYTYTPSNKATWVVKTQNLIGGQTYSCAASLDVQLEKP